MELSIRIIPVLLLQNKGLVKTIKFKNPSYIGDPINAVRILNDKEVDELIFLDIGASKGIKPIDFEAVANITDECFMPLGIGGGIKTTGEAAKLFKMGVEKIILNTCAVKNPDIVKNLSDKYGSQSIVICLDLKRNVFGKYSMFIKGGSQKITTDMYRYIDDLQINGAGELIINSIDNDGMMNGYDVKIIRDISSRSNIPVIACGGAGKTIHFKEAIKNGASAVAAGSMFVYQGKNKAVLINYPKEKFTSDND